jgi:rhombotail lipoprotein
MKRLLVVISVLVLASCTGIPREQVKSSSLVDYLYPQGARPELHPQMPLIRLPARVGLAFVPGDYRIVASEKQGLLQQVKESFEQHSFIEKIEIIPDNYLRRNGGFASLEQVGRMFGVEQVALVSYDQVITSRENNASLLYWTIVGLYIVPGHSNSVQTFVDTAVFDIKSRKMLFRAPGINRKERYSTAIGASAAGDRSSRESFRLAVDDMTANLQQELSGFRQRVRSGEAARVTYRHGGGGSVSVLMLLLLLSLLVAGKKLRTR